jgi:lipopolysaccharide export system permease protein
MRILDRYIIKNFLLPLIYCLFIFCLLYVVVDIFEHLDRILANKVSSGMLYIYYLSFLPLIFVQTAPVAALLSTVYMLSTLNKNNELTAIKACGVSIWRILLPIFALGLILSLLVFIVNERVIPKTILTANEIRTAYIEKMEGQKNELKTFTNITVYGNRNQMLYAKKFNFSENRLNEIIILEHDEGHRLKRKIMASEGIWRDNRWIFSDCTIYRFGTDGQPMGQPLVFKSKIIRFSEAPKDLIKHEIQTGYMNYEDLRGHIKKMSDADADTVNSLKTELYFKTAVPFVCIIIVLLGVPFAINTARGGAMASIGISVGVGLLYYGSIYLFLAMGKGGLLPPVIAAHIANVIFSITAFILIRRAPM